MSSRYPGCIVLLMDQSASMSEPIAGGTGTSRAVALATAADQLLDELVQRCLDPSGRIMPWCDIAAIGYSGHGVRCLIGPAKGQPTTDVPWQSVFVSTADLDGYARDEPGNNPLLPSRRWIDPLHDGVTPMSEAFAATVAVLRPWAAARSDSFPPVVLHITDARFNTGDPTSHVRALTALGTSEGAALLFNLYLSSDASCMIEYPAVAPVGGDAFATWLYSSSSEIPPQLAEASQFPLAPAARGFVLNGGAASLLRFFMWGTPGRAI